MNNDHMCCMNKCYIEFIDCDRDYDCIFCEIAKKFWEEMRIGNSLIKTNLR